MRPIRILVVVFVALVSSAAHAYTLQFDPPQPTSHDAVTALTHIYCPKNPMPSVVRSGQSIWIDFLPMAVGCIATPPPERVEVNLGVLNPGTYEVTLRFSGHDAATKTLDVRGVDPFGFYPPGAPVSGGGTVLVDWKGRQQLIARGGKVLFGETEGIVKPSHFGELLLEPPPHAPGIVDVTVIDADGRTFVARHAFKYYEPASTPDPFVFEPLLVPVHYEGQGVAGSEWRSYTVVAPINESVPLIFHSPPCSTCSRTVTTPVRLDAPPRNEGLTLYFGRGGRNELAVSSRVRDVSRKLLTAGTGIPVVGRDQFRDRVVFADVPAEREHRVMLRIWERREFTAFSSMTVAVRLGPHIRSVPVVLTPTPDPDVLFGSLDISPLLAHFPADESPAVHVYSRQGRVWALLSITNNDTQHVTVMAPHPYDEQ